MNRRHCQSGFALLLTLALVMLAGSLLTGLALRSASAALDAQSATERLQRRWATISCQATLLACAEQLLDAAKRDGQSDGSTENDAVRYVADSSAQWSTTCRLAGLDYQLVFTDEQAKLNVNRLLQSETGPSAQRIIERLSPAADASADGSVQVRLRTSVDRSTGASGKVSQIGGYAQIFENAQPAQLLGDDQAPGLCQRVTCWGDGRVNLRRATEQVLRQACDPVLSRSEQDVLIRAHRADPDAGLQTLFNRLKDALGSTQVQQLQTLLTDESGCHGLWIVQHGPQRSWYSLAVGTGVAKRDPQTGVPGKLAVSQPLEFEW